jgi:hypothetical protein
MLSRGGNTKDTYNTKAPVSFPTSMIFPADPDHFHNRRWRHIDSRFFIRINVVDHSPELAYMRKCIDSCANHAFSSIKTSLKFIFILARCNHRTNPGSRDSPKSHIPFVHPQNVRCLVSGKSDFHGLHVVTHHHLHSMTTSGFFSSCSFFAR